MKNILKRYMVKDINITFIKVLAVFLVSLLTACQKHNFELVKNDKMASFELLNTTDSAIQDANFLKQAMLHGKWKHWYRGEHKVPFSLIEKKLEKMKAGEEVEFPRY